MDQDRSKYQLSQFQDDLDRYGARLEDWPDAVRAQAQALIDASAEARMLIDAAKVLWDSSKAAPVKAPAGLAQRIVKTALEQSPPKKKTN